MSSARIAYLSRSSASLQAAFWLKTSRPTENDGRSRLGEPAAQSRLYTFKTDVRGRPVGKQRKTPHVSNHVKTGLALFANQLLIVYPLTKGRPSLGV